MEPAAPAAHAALRGAQEVVAVSVDAGARLEVGGKRISHAGHQEPGRRLHDDRRVEEDHVGALLVENVVEGAVLAVDHREGAGGRVVGGDRWHDADGKLQVVGNGLCRVQHLSAANADHAVALRVLLLRDDLLDSLLGHLAVEDDVLQLLPGSGEARIKGCREVGLAALAGDDQEGAAEPRDVAEDLLQFLVSLNVTGRGKRISASWL